MVNKISGTQLAQLSLFLTLLVVAEAPRASAASDALNAYQQTWIAIHQLSFVTAADIAP
jgi:hypothetical protein